MLKRLASLFVVLVSAATLASAQAGVCINDVAQTISNGVIAPVPFAKIYLCPGGTSQAACLAPGGASVGIYASAALSATGSVTAYSASSGVLTLTISARVSPFGVGELVTFSGFSGGLTAINGKTLAVLASPGATTTSFAVATALVTGSGSDSGTATPQAAANPFTSDVGGNYFFCTGVGHYALVISGPQGTYAVPDVTLANNASAGTANSLAGGTLGAVPYQSAPSTTAFMASPTTSGRTFVPAWQPSGVAVDPAPIDLGTFVSGMLPTVHYQTMIVNGITQTQEPALALSANFTCADNPGTSTLCDLIGVGTAGTYAFPSSITTDSKGRVTAVTAGSAPVSILVYSKKNLATNVSVTANTLTTVDSLTVNAAGGGAPAFPTNGGSYRVWVCYSYFGATGSGVVGETEVLDSSSNSFALSEGGQFSGSAGTNYQACGLSTTTYTGASPETFTVKVENTGGQTIDTTSSIIGLASNMSVAIVDSN